MPTLARCCANVDYVGTAPSQLQSEYSFQVCLSDFCNVLMKHNLACSNCDARFHQSQNMFKDLIDNIPSSP